MAFILPAEKDDPASQLLMVALERHFVRLLLWISPLVFLTIWILAACYGRAILFFHPSSRVFDFTNSKGGFLVAVATVGAIVAWWTSLNLSIPRHQIAQCRIACCVAAGIVFVANISFLVPKARWYFQEAVKIRAPQLNFARNIISMQQLLEPQATAFDRIRIGLIGSSQINLGVDSDQLSSATNHSKVIKVCLPGMVPLQYQALAVRIAELRPNFVICWLSEFDFFREQDLPTSRLRWCADTRNLRRLKSVLDWAQCWRFRSDLADLQAASVMPVWRQRELFQMLVFRFWWRFDAEQGTVTQEELQIGAVLANKEQGIENARRNIQRTPLIETNFAAFADFQRQLNDAGVGLIVFEGESHPDTMSAYPPDFRRETRDRLRKLSSDLDFVYVQATDRVQFDASDWMDAVHLNESGRKKLTSALVDTLSNLSLITP